jgi:phosphatidylserine synthase
MNEDRDLNRISQNYKHILWSILAIIIIIAAIRISRTDVKTAE